MTDRTALGAGGTKYLRLAICWFVAALWGGSLASAGEPLHRGEKFTLESKVMGESREIWVHTPPAYAASGMGYPVLYLTDGPAHFFHTASTVDFLASNGRIPFMIVVGVANTDRTRDLTPTRLVGDVEGGRGFPTSGGADRFLEFFREELIPHIEKNYRTEPYRVFAGHSFGGLFAVHAFANHSDLFDAYIAASPSAWWDHQLVVRQAKSLLEKEGELPKSIYFTVGNENPEMTESFEALRVALAASKRPGLQARGEVFDDEDHGSIVMRTHYRGLEFIFDGWRLAPAPNGASIADVLKHIRSHYEDLSMRYKFRVRPNEQRINNFGYQVLGAGRVEDAIAVFEYNVQLYPASANVYDSLGEAQEKLGQVEPARSNYKKAWELGAKNGDPNVEIFKKNYERLSVKSAEL